LQNLKNNKNKVLFQNRFGLFLLLFLLIISFFPLVLATNADRITSHGFEVFNDFSAKMKVQRVENIYQDISVQHLIEYNEENQEEEDCCDETFQWIQLDTNNVGRIQINNHFRYDGYYFMQQFNIHQIQIITSNDTWNATFDKAENYRGKKNSDDVWQIIYGKRYYNPDRIIHDIWVKVINMALKNERTQGEEGTLHLHLNYTLTTYFDKCELKIGVTVNLENSGLPINENTNFKLRMTFDNDLCDRTNPHHYVNLEPSYMDDYVATYTIPNGKEVSTFELNRNYIEIRDNVEINKVADPRISGPNGEGKNIRGDYNFTDLVWGHSTQVYLDPTLHSSGYYGNSPAIIGGLQIIPLIIISFIGLILSINILRKRKF